MISSRIMLPIVAGRGFERFEQDIADKSIADDDIRAAVEQVFRFDIADEIERQRRDQGAGFVDKFVAFAFFFAVGEHADTRIAQAKRFCGVDFAHQRELRQPFRF